MATSEELLKQMYDNNLASQKAGLESDYKAALSDLDAQKEANRKNMEHNVRLTKTEADRSAVNNAEYYNAAGLSTGARAQARLASENQLLADLTAIRAAQQDADANVERQRGLMSQQYAAAIREAQANNDMAKAQALYEAAKEQEARMWQEQQNANAAARSQQEAAAKIMAESGDFTLLAQLYGLTPEQTKALQADYETKNQTPVEDYSYQNYQNRLAYAKALAENMNDYSLWEQLITEGYQAPKTEEQYDAEIISSLKAQFPTGVIQDKALWDSLVSIYGVDFLTKNGLRGYYSYDSRNGGRTLDFAAENK